MLFPSNINNLTGAILDEKYEIHELIGSGGWGRVYRATQLSLQRPLAVKVMSYQDDVALARFEREAKACNKLIHQNIVSVLDFGTRPLPYLVMDFVDGKTLSQILKSTPSEETSVEKNKLDIIKMLIQICDALSYAHDEGVVHRDLKPSNIMVCSDGSAKILDFGLALEDTEKLTRTGETVGSPLYMSPEQCRGERVDCRTDIYAMGCILFEVLSGKPPFDGTNLMECMYKHIREDPKPIANLPKVTAFKKISDIAFRCLAKSPEDRYQSMHELATDLRRALSGERLPVRVSVTRSFLRQISQTGTLMLLSVCIAVVAFLGLIVWINSWT